MGGRPTVPQRTTRTLSAEGQWGVVMKQHVYRQTPPPTHLQQAGAQQCVESVVLQESRSLLCLLK